MARSVGDAGDIGYPHRLRVTKAGTTPGTQDSASGTWTEGSAPVVVYDGPALVQDTATVLRRDEAGRTVEEADGKAFLPVAAAAALPALVTGLPATVTWEDGATVEAQILNARRLDRVVWLQGLGRR